MAFDKSFLIIVKLLFILRLLLLWQDFDSCIFDGFYEEFGIKVLIIIVRIGVRKIKNFV